MATKQFSITPDLALPSSPVTETFALLAARGARQELCRGGSWPRRCSGLACPSSSSVRSAPGGHALGGKTPGLPMPILAEHSARCLSLESALSLLISSCRSPRDQEFKTLRCRIRSSSGSSERSAGSSSITCSSGACSISSGSSPSSSATSNARVHASLGLTPMADHYTVDANNSAAR